jgi:hypothetical protein
LLATEVTTEVEELREGGNKGGELSALGVTVENNNDSKKATHALPLLPGVMEDDLAEEEKVVTWEAVLTCSPEIVARAVPLANPIAMHWLAKAGRQKTVSIPAWSWRAQRRGGWSSRKLTVVLL